MRAEHDHERGFGVYLHWPFCASKCPYCDFNSHVRPVIDEARYCRALAAELGHYAGLTAGRTVTSIFFGGGTPSLMAPASVGALIDRIAALWPVAGDAEVTLEANPSSVEAGRFAGYRAAGVNRASLGVQALNDADLSRLGRLHSAHEARTALEIATARFERVSFDLIYARPGQTRADWRAELGEALALAPGHLSLYQLTIEPDTPFAALHAAGKLATPPDDLAAGLFEDTQALCEAAGLPAYEISNHARPGEECRHNLVYWRYQPYVGVGPGAHGRVVPAGTGRCETLSERDPAAWLARVEAEGHATTTMTPLAPAAQADEMLLMGLRLAEGLDLARLRHLTGHEPDGEGLGELVSGGYLEIGPGERLRTTAAGRAVLNEIVLMLSRDLRPVVAAPAIS